MVEETDVCFIFPEAHIVDLIESSPDILQHRYSLRIHSGYVVDVKMSLSHLHI